MRAWLVKKFGVPIDALSLEEVPKPRAKDNEVIIRVEMAALNFLDILQCQGKYQERLALPFTIGAEVAGTIFEIHKGSKLKIGDRVSALPKMPSGGLAEFVAVPENLVFPIPDFISSIEATSMLITYHTAYYALHNCGKIREGEILIVHAGSGGVGSAAIQLGKAAGAYVIGTAGGEDKANICKNLGADIVINYLTEDFAEVVKTHTSGRGAKLIFDPVGGDVFDRSRKCISFEGKILAIGFASGIIPNLPINHILVKNYSVVGVHWGLFAKLHPKKVLEEHRRLIRLYKKRVITPLIYKEFQFEDVPEALQLLAGRKTWGKLVINCLN
jgi:NADPH:quinone reductase